MGAEIVIVVILLVLVIALFVISYMKKKKFNTELGQIREDLKVGDKVMTDTGVVGEVVDSYMEDEYKYFVLKTGRGLNVGYFTVHANAIYYVFNKENAMQEKKTVVKVSPKTEEKVEETEKTNTEESKTESEPVKKEEKPVSEEKKTKSSTTKKNTKSKKN